MKGYLQTVCIPSLAFPVLSPKSSFKFVLCVTSFRAPENFQISKISEFKTTLGLFCILELRDLRDHPAPVFLIYMRGGGGGEECITWGLCRGFTDE